MRPVRREDAPFILSLRTDPALSRFLHPVSGDLAAQLEWMEAYFERPADLYFIVERARTGTSVGTIALVDVGLLGQTAEWGRWILSPGSMAAVPSALLIYRVAFDVLGLDEVYCDTVADNEQVVSFHDSCGLERVATLFEHFRLGGAAYDAVRHMLSRERWPAVESMLAPKAERIDQLLQRSRR